MNQRSEARTGPDSELDGRSGWIVVGAAFVSMVTVFAVHYSFGSFFGAMADEFGSDRSATSLFFGLTNFFYFGLSVVTGRISDRVGPRPVLAVGAIAFAAGLIATSYTTRIWVGYLTYAIGVGTGVACGYVPMVAAVGGWFERRRTTALGIAVAGIGTGTLIGAPLSEWLIDEYGWRTTFRILAVAGFVLLAMVITVAERPPRATGQLDPSPVWRTIRRHRGFWILWASTLLLVLALFAPFVYLGDYMNVKNMSGSAGLLVGLLGVASVAGRIGLGALASRTSVLGLYRISFLAVGVSFFIWMIAGDRYAVLVLFVLFLGVGYGGYIALAPAVAAEIFGPIGLGGILGAVYTAAGIGGLIGPPLLGAVIDSHGYTTMLLVAIGSATVGLAVLLRLSHTGPEPARELRSAVSPSGISTAERAVVR